jgi:hypothetical protein
LISTTKFKTCSQPKQIKASIPPSISIAAVILIKHNQIHNRNKYYIFRSIGTGKLCLQILLLQMSSSHANELDLDPSSSYHYHIFYITAPTTKQYSFWRLWNNKIFRQIPSPNLHNLTEEKELGASKKELTAIISSISRRHPQRRIF